MRRSLAQGMLCVWLLGQAAACRPAGESGAPLRLTLGDLAFLTGQWAGTLQYLDYADNRTRQTLQASLDCTQADTVIVYRFSYVEPNGERVEGDEVRLRLDDNGTRLRLNEEEWRVAGRAIDQRRGKYEVVLSREGIDAERMAEFRRTLRFDGETLVIRTEVETSGGASRLVRNEHVLKRR